MVRSIASAPSGGPLAREQEASSLGSFGADPWMPRDDGEPGPPRIGRHRALSACKCGARQLVAIALCLGALALPIFCDICRDLVPDRFEIRSRPRFQGEFRTPAGKLRPNSASCARISPEVGPGWFVVDEVWPGLGRSSGESRGSVDPMFAQVWPGIGQLWPSLAWLRRSGGDFDRAAVDCPVSAAVRATSTDVCHMWPGTHGGRAISAELHWRQRTERSSGPSGVAER